MADFGSRRHRVLIMKIRTSTKNDLDPLVALFTESVHQIAAQRYTPEQLAAWAPESPDLGLWRSRLALVETLVAEINGALAGFISYTRDGHIEFLFTSPAFSRQGVASALFEAAPQRLHSMGATKLATDASLEARPFFEAKGFRTVEEHVVERNGVQFRRFAMARACGDECIQQGQATNVRD